MSQRSSWHVYKRESGQLSILMRAEEGMQAMHMCFRFLKKSIYLSPWGERRRWTSL